MSPRELSSPPSLSALYPRAVAVPLLRKLDPRPPGGGELPDTELELRDVSVDLDALSDYTEVCGFDRMDRLPPTYPHVIAFPLALRIMTERSFPFPVLGVVHIGNEIVQHRPISPDEPLSIRVRAQDKEPHEKGTQFTMAAEGRVGEELVWSSRNLYLRRHGGTPAQGAGFPSGSSPKGRNRETPAQGAGFPSGSSPKGRNRETPAQGAGFPSGSSPRGRNPRPSGEQREGAAPARAHWRVPDDIGRRYASVSGDRNPIHLHGLTAKLFGMPRPIAHGMWLKARCLAELEPGLPDAFTAAVRFKLPLFLPAQVAFGEREGGHFEVRDAASGKPHLTGTLTPGT